MSNRRRIIGFSLILLISVTAAYSTTYYVDYKLSDDCTGNYSIANRSCTGTDGTAFNTLYKANHAVTAGDIVYIRGGTTKFDTIYVGTLDSKNEGIHPAASGTSANNRITYATYKTEKVNFVGIDTIRSRGAFITDKNWIKISGHDGSTSAMNMKFSNIAEFLFVWSASSSGGVGSNYNEVSYCEFTQSSTFAVTNIFYRAFTIYRNSTYNWIHHCKFTDYGGCDTVYDIGSLFEIGYDDCGLNSDCLDNTANNVIENCIFYHGGHHTFGLMQNHNVIRNNIFHNEQWNYYAVDGAWHGYRNLYSMGPVSSLSGYAANHGYNLIENNRISHASENANAGKGGTGMTTAQQNHIIRYNDFYANAGYAISISLHPGTSARHNYIYNNTFYTNGWGATFPNIVYPPKRDLHDRCPIFFPCGYPDGSDWNRMDSCALKNNLFWKNYGYAEGLDMIISNNLTWNFSGCPGRGVCGDMVFDHNFNSKGPEIDPKFVTEGSYSNPHIENTNVEWYWPITPDGSDITTHNTEPNFNLQASSSAIDSGTNLTQAIGSGTNTATLIVGDARYFQPGWGNGAGGGASVPADWIAIGTVSNTAQINTIDYATNTITLASPKTWSDKAPVWLYKKSDGAIVLYGNAADCGAHEYSSANSIRIVTPSKRAFVSKPMILYSLRGQVVGELKGMRISGTMRQSLPRGVYFARTQAGWSWLFVKYVLVR